MLAGRKGDTTTATSRRVANPHTEDHQRQMPGTKRSRLALGWARPALPRSAAPPGSRAQWPCSAARLDPAHQVATVPESPSGPTRPGAARMPEWPKLHPNAVLQRETWLTPAKKHGAQSHRASTATSKVDASDRQRLHTSATQRQSQRQGEGSASRPQRRGSALHRGVPPRLLPG